jgi:hypothetical protein
MVRRVGSWDNHVEGLKWTLLAALGIAACSGRSERHIDPEAKAGEAGEGQGATGGTTGGGVGGSGTGAKGGTGSGANGGTGTSGRGGGGGTTGGTDGTTGGTGGSALNGGTGGAAGASSAGLGGTGQGGFRPTGCGAAAGYSNNLEACGSGFVHRTNSSECVLTDRNAAPPAGGAGGEASNGQDCEYDSECGVEPNGYCVTEDGDVGGGPFNYCVYACQSDADCETGEVCSCETDTYQRAGALDLLELGICRPASCETAAGCAPGMLCISPVDSFCGTPRPSTFQCQTEADECAGPADCAESAMCQHNGERFVCTSRPVCGRPFLVGAEARTAAEAAGHGWDHSKLDRVVALTLAERAVVAAHYRAAALMEHASIAAFARFTLELVALGAPAELVSASVSAMTDETAHTRLCVELADRYSDTAFSPGVLDVTNALSEPDLLAVVDRAVLEGIFGETSAALEAAWARDAAEDEAVRHALTIIAEDESRHAALAVRFIAWAAKHDERVLPLVERRFREAQNAAAKEGAPNSAPYAAEHGVLDAATRHAARNAMLHDVLPSVLAELRAQLAYFTLQPYASVSATAMGLLPATAAIASST